jgi:hypothetical protein
MKSIHPEVKKFTRLYNFADDLFDVEMVENHFNGKTSKIFIVPSIKNLINN